MPQQIFYPNQGLVSMVGAVQESLTGATLRLFKSGWSPDITTKQADLLTHEANFTGYTAGGIEVTGWDGPFLAPEGGFAIQTPSITFATGSPTTVPNLIGGYWLENASNEAVVICEFAEAQPMQTPFQQVTIQVRLVFPN